MLICDLETQRDQATKAGRKGEKAKYLVELYSEHSIKLLLYDM